MRNLTARIAGLLYLIVVVSGLFTLAYVPSQLVVAGDLSATVSRIIASETLYRLSAAAYAVCYTAFLLLPLALHRLLRSVHEQAAVLMVAFAVVIVPLSFVNLAHMLEVLRIVGEMAGAGPETARLNAQAAAELGAYESGIFASTIFWGLWLLPFGYLVFMSGVLPKVLGVLLVLGGVGYVVNFFGAVLSPDYTSTAVASILSLPAPLGEIGTCLWLLVFGVKEESLPS